MKSAFVARNQSAGKLLPPKSDRRAATVRGNALRCLLSIILFFCAANAALAAAPAFKQEKDNQATSGNTAKVTFSASTSSGNLIAIYLIWDNTGTASVSDSWGNSYASAVPQIRWFNSRYSAQIFYTISSGSGIDSVTATFGTKLSQFGIIYAHEYSGIRATAPIDVTAAAAGTSGALSSGSATTANDNDLLFAGGVSANWVTGAGAGYTARSTAHGNMTEDRVVSVKGSYSATAGNSGGAWAMQMLAFKGAASGDATAPTVPTGLAATVVSASQINLSWSASTDPDNSQNQLTYGVYRNGARIGTTGAGVTSWADSGLAPATTYSYIVSSIHPPANTSPQSLPLQPTPLPPPTTRPPPFPT